MSYQVIARKWRPQSFDQVVGQNHITQTLNNALRNGRLHHALIFTGPRGTGKTSSARILAKSLRCSNAVEFVPCGACDSCEDITAGRAVDVLEIDGASNNGVDSIRELRETVGYLPSSGKYKIYIIDEVHMLSISAFNALLKTLEEPPPNVVFIMATTEVHKLPQTILSRCQRFDFRRITTRQITDRLKLICEAEKVTAEESALWAIARQGDGSMRDSQSLLDQVITFANGPLTREGVVKILGLTDRALLLEVMHAIIERKNAGVINVIRKLGTSGVEPDLFIQELLEMVRHLLLLKVTQAEFAQLVEMADTEIEDLQSLCGLVSEEDLHLLFDMTLKGATDISRAQDPKLVLEVILLRLASAPKLMAIQELLKSGALLTAAFPTEGQELAPARGTAAPVHQKIDPGLPPEERWLQFANLVRVQDPLLSAKVENLLFLEASDTVLKLAIPEKLKFLKDQMADPSVRKKLQSFVDHFWGAGYSIDIKLTKDNNAGSSAQAMEQKKHAAREEEISKKVAAHPMVQSAREVFKGKITSIQELNKPNRGR